VEISQNKGPFSFISYSTPIPTPISLYDKIFLLSCWKKQMKEFSPFTSQNCTAISGFLKIVPCYAEHNPNKVLQIVTWFTKDCNNNNNNNNNIFSKNLLLKELKYISYSIKRVMPLV
jgi:hypothetical protein